MARPQDVTVVAVGIDGAALRRRVSEVAVTGAADHVHHDVEVVPDSCVELFQRGRIQCVRDGALDMAARFSQARRRRLHGGRMLITEGHGDTRLTEGTGYGLADAACATNHRSTTPF